MKRIVLWVLSTLSTVVVLFGYHTSTSSVMATSTGAEGAFSASLTGQAAAGARSSTTTTGTAPPADSSATMFTGTAAQTRYGPVQVQLEVTGSKITHVSVLRYPDQGGRDLQISNFSLPQLVQDTLDSQGGAVAMVSGATYTSDGYLQSLQSALDQAGL